MDDGLVDAPAPVDGPISRGALRISDARLLMDHLESSLRQSTYLKN